LEKLDLKKKFRQLYLPSDKKISVVDVPALKYIMYDGQTRPGEKPEDSQEFQDAFSALYGTAYTLKFMSKQRQPDPIDFTVMAMEGLWWTNSGAFDPEKAEPWFFTLMMLQPDHITEDMFGAAVTQLETKKPELPLEKVRFETFQEGLCIQTMHIGPYAEEISTLAKMRAFAEENGYIFRGYHHEIYLGDPRRAKPENLRTVLRQPVEKKKNETVVRG
jgi:hypothetical protein